MNRNYTWDLNYLLDGKTFEQNLENYKNLHHKLENLMSTAFDTEEKFRQWNALENEYAAASNRLHNYVSNSLSASLNNATLQGYEELLEFEDRRHREKTAGFTNLIIKNKNKILTYLKNDEFKSQARAYDLTFKSEKHLLPDEQEKILSLIGPTSETAHNVFSIFTDSDLKFDAALDKDGKEHKLTHGTYQQLLQSEDRILRQNAYTNYHRRFYEFRQTLTKLLYSNYLSLNKFSQIRKFDNYITQTTFHDEVTPEFIKQVYQSVAQYRDINEAFRTSADLAYKKKLKLDQVEPWDTAIPLTQNTLKYSIEEAEEQVCEALKILGDEYLDVVKRSYRERWIDYEARENKYSGAYSIGGTYGLDRYHILMNFNGTIGSVETLAHELGHSLNSYYFGKIQPPEYNQTTIFTAEVASICNEALLHSYWLKKHKDDKYFKLEILSKIISGFIATTSRQVAFSEFEWESNDLINKGQPYTADVAENIYEGVINKFIGKSTKPRDKDGKLVPPYRYSLTTSLRISHFYVGNFYVYKYAIGQVAGLLIAHRIMNAEPNAVKKYIDFLSSGTSLPPLETIKLSGVDLSKTETWKEAGDVIRSYIKEFSKLVEELSFNDNN